MKKHGEIAYVVIVESYNPYDIDGYYQKCQEYGFDVAMEDLKYVLDELIERDHLKIEKETGMISLNYNSSDMMDEMAYELQFNDEVYKSFAKIINKHGNIDVCFDYLPDISRLAFEETLRNMMK